MTAPGRRSHPWLDLVEMSGLLLSAPVLHHRFPDGPDRVPAHVARWLTRSWERFQVDPAEPQRRHGWLEILIHDVLGLSRVRWRRRPDLPPEATVDLVDLDQSLRPDGVLLGDDDELMLALWVVDIGQRFDRVERAPGRWRATPQAKVERWLRGTSCPFVLLTDGVHLRLVHVPAGLPAAWVEFDASLFTDERGYVDGFLTTLGAPRFTGPEEKRLLSVVEESQRRQAELTDALGKQVRDAVERLILALDRADRASGRELLAAIAPDELYRAAVYVVMRLVFLLFAEERRLLPHGNVLYDDAYGLGRLQHRLDTERHTHPETYRRETDAWPQLLALFRLVFHGCTHPDVVLPAYGGDLFDPQAFAAMSLLEDERVAITNREVHLILRKLTFGAARVGRERILQRYSYRTLDVEHIGYLYEGLLDHHAARAAEEPMVKLVGAGETAWPLSELERRSGDDLVEWLADQGCLGGNRDRIAAHLAPPLNEDREPPADLDPKLAARCRPYTSVIQPAEIVPPGSFYLTTSESRRATGTHYTPIQYTRAMVSETLGPLVVDRETGRPRSPRDLLALKVCDPAMGSGAFLVQVVRYLADALVDAWWEERERRGERTPLYLPYAEPATDDPEKIPLPSERTEAEEWARRLVAERVVAGVDRNPLAAEMAKLSLWLVTLARDKPFSFLDHALRCGDSLLGLADLAQLERWSLDGTGDPRPVLEAVLRSKVAEAAGLRRDLAALASSSLEEVRTQARLHERAEKALEGLRAAADLLVAPALAEGRSGDRERLAGELLLEVSQRLDEPGALSARAAPLLGRHAPFHWPLEFPEVFDRDEPGFDAFVGNPPFMGGQKITGAFGRPYREHLVASLAGGTRGSADLVAYFFLRAYQLLRPGGCFGLLATNTIAEGDTRQVGLERIEGAGGAIYSAWPNEPWPNDAAVVTSRVHLRKGPAERSRRLAGREVEFISAYLTDREEIIPQRLAANRGIAFQGSIILGLGFTLPEERALEWIARDDRYRDVLFPYLNGEDLNTHPEQKPSRWVICFWDWPEERAREYPLAFEQVEREVKPERDRLSERTADGRRRKRNWWLYGRDAKGLYHAVGRGHRFDRHPTDWDPDLARKSHVLVCSLVSKHLTFVRSANNEVFAHRLAVFADAGEQTASALMSVFHEAWARHNSSSLETRLNYSPSDCFETFPVSRSSVVAGRVTAFVNLRSQILHDKWIGLTRLCNRYHNPKDNDGRLDRLRELQVGLDRAVAGAYGWDDLDLEHDFHEVGYVPENDRVRFTVSEKARRRILDRLAQLNRDRYAEEVASGLHDKKKTRAANKVSVTAAKSPRKAPVQRPSQPALFPGAPEQQDLFREYEHREVLSKAAEPETSSFDPVQRAILEDLRAHPGWHSRADVLSRTGVEPARWSAAISALVDGERVERKGRKRGTRYRQIGESDG